MVSTWNRSLTKNLCRCHLFSIFPFFNGQPSMVSAVLFVSKDHTAVFLCDPSLTEELKDNILKYIVYRIDDLMWSFYLITLFRPLDHLHTVGCIFEILTNTNTERQRQYTITKHKWGPEPVAFLSRLPSHSVPASHNLHIQGWENEGKKHSNAFVNVSVRLLSMLILPHNLLRHSSV